ncbi:Vacuolar sorting protein 9 (VPS9) domain family protein [Candida parapsilosis]|uniref:Vacuolar sorting protein 9 (VPS9) domain family protein n=1 Tax=Candida parapsilosis TaxID=5480 RepID=A0A8X7NJT8_CANPA|nr:Vacuolar sorting protein 9 (VPS9) domain family protein [Candida parapsilosis]KAF6043906.1 Vacuolar sorting protein 9 (VPS9) domain family protein [Candida parapsilosis]KAF6045474.1 Vacuolar sorting protein 9 (VPS9) domain family protein [Candida parapsilosis]KAF6060260.1 Vacuolar sorting protein 9 (VPS9) domain family protein [Candida parapsilosis]KAI5904267.1 Vacuolar protein sorting-associated protein 9a [Candida parapsilosis]
MSFNNLAFNVSKSTPTTSTSNTNTTFSKSVTSSSKGSNSNATEPINLQPSSSSSAESNNDLAKVSSSADATASPQKSPIHKATPSHSTTAQADSDNQTVDHLPFIASPPSTKLGLSPTLTAPAVVTIDNEAKNVHTKGKSKTDLIGLFDKFDIKGERGSHSSSGDKPETSNDLIDLNKDEISAEKRTVEEEHDTEHKLEKMESDDGDTSKETASVTEKDKDGPTLTVEKMSNTAHLMMTIQPYFPPEEASSSVVSNSQDPSMEEGKSQQAEPIREEKDKLETSNPVEPMKEEDEEEKEQSDHEQVSDVDKSFINDQLVDMGSGTTEEYHDKLNSDVESRGDRSLVDEDENDRNSRAGSDSVSYASSTSQLPSVATSPSKTPLGDITGSETECKGIDDIKIDTKDIGSSQPDSPVGKTHLNIKYKVNPTEQHQESHKSFDFQTFLLQIRKKSADPIVRYLRSFLGSYIKQVNSFSAEQRISIIEDFKGFIHEKFKLYEPFASMDSIDLENSREGLEKLLMNRLYDLCFPPEVLKNVSPVYIPGSYTDDLIQDKNFSMQLEKYSWVNGSHFDIDMTHLSSVSLKDGQDFLDYATTELNKINNYRAPRDKIICILNSCKIIFSYLKISHKETNADSFIPLLILVIIKAKTEHLISNIHYIESFRSKEWLSHGETSYYLSSIEGAISFIQNMTKDDLTISDEEYEAHMEAWEAQNKLKEEQKRQEMEKLQKIELKRQELQQQRENSEQRPPTPKRKLSQPQPRHVQTGPLNIEESSHTGAANLSPSNVLFSSAELLTKSISQFLSPSPQNTNTHETNTRSGREGAPSPVSSPPPPALPPRKSSRASSHPVSNERHRSNNQYQPEAPMEDEIDSEQMKAAYDILKDVFPTLDTNILKDIIFLNKGDVDVCIDACLPLVEDE